MPTYPLIETLCDTFDGPSIDLSIWEDNFWAPYCPPGTPPYVSGGVLYAHGWGWTVQGYAPFDFTDSVFTVQHPSGAFAAAGSYLLNLFNTISGNPVPVGALMYAEVEVTGVSGGTRSLRVLMQFSTTTDPWWTWSNVRATVPWDHDAMLWWRLDCRGGRVAFQTSPDGTTWTDIAARAGGVGTPEVGLSPYWNQATSNGNADDADDWQFERVGTCGAASGRRTWAAVIG